MREAASVLARLLCVREGTCVRVFLVCVRVRACACVYCERVGASCAFVLCVLGYIEKRMNTQFEVFV